MIAWGVLDPVVASDADLPGRGDPPAPGEDRIGLAAVQSWSAVAGMCRQGPQRGFERLPYVFVAPLNALAQGDHLVIEEVAEVPGEGNERCLEISDDGGVALVAAEYTCMRAEILKLIELQSAVVTFAGISFGAVLSLGFQQQSGVIILVQPFLSLILGLTWLNHAHAVRRIAEYLAEVVEPKAPRFIGWENFTQRRALPKARLGYWGVRAIFLGTPLLSLVAALIITKHGVPSEAFWIAYLMSTTVAALTVILFFAWGESDTQGTVTGSQT